MLRVKTYLDKSSIPGAGIGCFAKELIVKDQLIWEFDPFFDQVYTQENLDNMDDITRQFIKTYCFKQNDLYYLCVDNGRFFNHSETPNTLDLPNTNKTYALRDIQPGEEILSDYATFGISEDDAEFNLTL